MSTNFGFSNTILRIVPRSFDPGDSLSGHAYERGCFRSRFPMKPRWHWAPGEGEDFIPVWETESEATAVVARLKAVGIGERYSFKVVDIDHGIHAGGPATVHPFRGVDGWTIPPVVRAPVESQWRQSTPGK